MSLNVLVVDDSSVTRAMIIKSLRVAGVPLGDVHEAANGQEGLDCLEANWIDLAFVDINMPVMNGEEMIERVKANPAWESLPLIVCSTEGSQVRIERLQQKGAEFIHKPFSPEVVREVVAGVTGLDLEAVGVGDDQSF
jgi:two-component system chemotaxis response regulator CheY